MILENNSMVNCETIRKTTSVNFSQSATRSNMVNEIEVLSGSISLPESFLRSRLHLQAIVSHLEFMDVEIEQDDLNQKFLTSLAPEWLMYTIVWRNRDDLNTMSLDDVYNHLKVYEPEVQKKSESNSQNMAFISSSNTSSEKGDVHTASVLTTSTQISTASTNVAVASISHDIIDEDDIKEIDIKWNMALLSMRADGFGRRMSYMANEEENYALVANEEALTEFALMAKSSSSSKNEEVKELIRIKKVLDTVQFPPPAQVYSPLKKDMSWTGLPEFVDDTVTDYSRHTPSIYSSKSNTSDLQNSSFSVSEHRESSSSIMSKPMIKFVKAVDCPGVIKTNKTKTARKSPVKYAEMYRNTSKSPKVRETREKLLRPQLVGFRDLNKTLLKKGNSQNNIDDKGYWDSGGGKITGKGIIKTDFKLKDDTNVLLRTLRQHNIYSIDLNNVVPRKNLTCLVAKAFVDESMLWHRRLGHLNFKTMNKLVRNNLVKGLPSKCFENDNTFVACLKGKQYKASCKTKLVNSVSKPLHTLHMDLFGPTSVSSLNHKWYCLVMTDDFSRFTWTFFLRTKDETRSILMNFIIEIENLKDLKVKIIRCDNGGEFKNKEMNELCTKKRIRREFSNAKTPQQNRVVKRRNKTLIKATRTMLADAKLPVTFWAEAVNTACYVQNRVLVNKSQNKTPYELFNCRTPAIGFLRPFGCHVVILNTLDHLGKFDAKGDKGYFVSGISNPTASLKVPSADQLEPAISITLESVIPTNVWILVDCPKGVRPIGTKWVLKNKKDKRGIVIRNKARLVAQGYTQEEGIDYEGVFASVTRIEAIRPFLAYASFIGFVVYQMDVKSAFLYGTIDKEVYVMQPSGFQDPEFPDRVYKVEKEMYGLHKAPRAWYESTKENPTCSSENPWGKDGPGKDVELHLYRFMIESLMYLTASRPDIMFVVCACARQQVTPKKCHLHVVKRIFRYLKGHPKLGLWYPKESPFDLVAYSDSDYGGATQDRKSITGGYQFLGRRLISWQYKKQTIDWGIHRILMVNLRLTPLIAFCDYHNMIAILEKTEHNIDFHQIVDFIKASHIMIETTNKEAKILANVNGKPRTISESSLRRQYFRRATRIAQSKALSPAAYEPVSLLRDNRQGEAFPTVSSLDAGQDRENIIKTSALPHECSPRVTSLDADEGNMQQKLQELMDLCTSLQGQRKYTAYFRGCSNQRGIIETWEEVGAEKRTELGSNDTEEMVNVLSSMEAVNILTSKVAAVSVSPVAGVSTVGVPTVSGLIPTVSAIFTTASVVTPYSRRPREISTNDKGKEKVVEFERLNEQLARDSEIARLHAEEKLKMMIEGLDRSNEVITKHLQEYEQVVTDLSVREKIKLINELVKYKDHHAKILKYQAQQSKPLSKKEQREFYMSVHRSHDGWKTKHFRGMTLEEIKDKFILVWKQLEDFVPMSSKEEGERIKRKGLKLDQGNAKRIKTSEDEDLKGMMQLVPLEEVYVEALQVKHPIIDWEATKDKEKELWVELKRLFEPDFEDQLCTHNQNFIQDPLEWRLYDTCSLHHVVTKDQDIFMLVERDYPLRKGLATVMICNKLQVENYSQMANDLILKVYNIANSPR
uniref:Putative ribonuclease H-like domain-containing protein n=1 Tax=Tanacetum cinerariifolium TaxID=118510 RepID=A0A6L2KX47_TANCI|nr:putative ribonuclease H-like domain-containing protein [Tanacetum cinerariifolium]